MNAPSNAPIKEVKSPKKGIAEISHGSNMPHTFSQNKRTSYTAPDNSKPDRPVNERVPS
jgi:hypothetical protein